MRSMLFFAVLSLFPEVIAHDGVNRSPCENGMCPVREKDPKPATLMKDAAEPTRIAPIPIAQSEQPVQQSVLITPQNTARRGILKWLFPRRRK